MKKTQPSDPCRESSLLSYAVVRPKSETHKESIELSHRKWWFRDVLFVYAMERLRGAGTISSPVAGRISALRIAANVAAGCSHSSGR